ncbi:MAG: hypothetical protein K9N62_14895 [Verrucomicrobia bacterium]|jgi:hypothetical protein|nr:hypothetical protein [Verrucomicrobiota bacterium]
MLSNLRLFLATLLLSLVAVGCGESGPPEPLTDAELPTAMREAFAGASASAKELADKAVAAYEGEKFPEATLALESLLRQPDLDEKARTVASQCLLSANEKLRIAQEQGSSQAEEFLKYRGSVK